ncbi:MAG TPA: hypothetical protein GXX77_06960 [Candidatus Cloacimonetes bacterium]|nr:hypothetical protein [Candidatus Cloacimonadota bacterium]
MKYNKVSMIVSREIGKSIAEELFAFGIRHHFNEIGRSSILNRKTGFSSFFSKPALINYPVDILSFFVEDDEDRAVLSYFAKKYDLRSPGKGSIFSQEIEVLEVHKEYMQKQELRLKHNDNENRLFRDLTGIICVVQRGEGDKVARVALNYGTSVPATTHGEGSGVRDKLGLLRITLPSEKELINLVLSRHDADAVMELYISEAKLDEPGRGLAYSFPIKYGMINTKISRSQAESAASIEQMVSAIDSLKGGMEWRKSSLERESFKNREFLYDLAELNLICEEGRGTELVEAAMSSGAPGATICKIRYNNLDNEMETHRSVKELCKMIVPESQVPEICEALKKTGCFENDAKAFLYSLPVQKAFTYRAKRY